MVNLTTEQKVRVTVHPKTAGGNPAAVDGVPGWAVSDPNLATLEIAPDGLSAYVFAGLPGSGSIMVSADADLSAGVREIVGILNLTVGSAEADTLDLVAEVPLPV